MITVSTVVAIVAGVYEAVVRIVPTISLKWSWISKVISIASLISESLNHTKE